jgi:type I restriction-modification system DNA methylase subunit
VAPLGFKSLLAASLLAIISEERPEGLRSLGALNEATVTAKDPNGDLRAGLDAIKMLPDHVISEILQAWHGAASKIDRRRVSGALRRYVDETSTRKLGAEFTTSTSVAKLIEEITSGLDVLDMCCGYGTTLREFRRKTRVRVGQEINHEVATLARLLARVEGYEVEILNEDSLAVCHTDWLRIGFHTVIVDPPMGVRLREDQVSPTDLRWTHSAVARSTQAEDYWIQSALAYLRPSSVEAPFRAVVILRSGWFFDGSGGPFRDALLKAGVVEAVISLGSGTKMSTAIPVSILVLRKAGIGSAKVRMIDATEAGRVRRGVRELELEEIKAIAAAMNGRETGQTISTVKVLDVPIQEVLQNGSVLDVRRYLPNDRSAASLGMAVKELNKVVDLLSKAFRAIGD